MEMKVKASIQVTLDEAGGISLKTSSRNKITNLGMLEFAKIMIMSSKEEPSNIVVPQL